MGLSLFVFKCRHWFLLSWWFMAMGHENMAVQAQGHREPSEHLKLALELAEWVKSKPNAQVSEKIDFQDDHDPEYNMAMASSATNVALVAKEDFAKDETIMIIPDEALLGSAGGECQTMRQLFEEYDQGSSSEYYPYIRLLLGGGNDHGGDGEKVKDEEKDNGEYSNKGVLGRALGSWSPHGRNLLQTLVGQDLLPNKPNSRLCTKRCAAVCPKDSTRRAWQQNAFAMMHSRAWGTLFVPLFDLINHRNGKWRNVDIDFEDGHARVYAVRDIAKGEQLYMSNTECNDCGANRKYKFVAQHMLRDYGYVEPYPRRWQLEEFVVEVDVDDDGNKILTWPHEELPKLGDLNWFHAQLIRLRNLDDTIANGVAELESDFERHAIAEFHKGYKEALELALTHREGRTNTVEDMEYDPLLEPKGIAVEGSNEMVCLHNPNSRSWDTSDTTVSQYQEIRFTYNEKLDNTCLALSDWLQTCTNFRPHYHEAFVHVPAQYVNDVKRVIFMGGGDNMILHEILKYPNLELVVGMELDQQVIRSAYKNLGTLPYFDDHRVHWYFGDATKSFFALPESYFGTFDLVLLDLQTFVADALRVTDKLTIMDTAILLMKQDGGVIAKNEDFPVRINTGFAKYTVDLEYHDLPHICQQSITMGSNSIDFLKTEPKYHGIKTMAINLTSPENVSANHFHAWYNYRHTVADSCKADDEKSAENDVTVKDGSQMGLMVILEAENLSIPLDSIPDIQSKISAAVTNLDLTMVAISSNPDFDEKFFVCILKEGYVTVRVFAEEKYIAFDFLLWSSIEHIDEISEVLVAAVGGDLQKTSSSFRFVTAGMTGLDSHHKNALAKIATETQESLCQDNDPGVSVPVENYFESVNQDSMTIVLNELITFLMTSSKMGASSLIGVFCRNKGSCPSLEGVQKLTSVNVAIVPIYSCDSFDDMSACEKNTADFFQGLVAENKKLDVLVFDAQFPFAMGQIMEKILRNKVFFSRIIEPSHLVLTPVPNGESWRNVLLDRFRTDMVLFDPAYRADIHFLTSASGIDKTYVEWCLFSSGDQNFFNHLSSSLAVIKEKTGLEPSLEEAANGVINIIADFKAKFFRDRDYDRTRSMRQWSSQKPIGHQTIFQMALKQPKTPVEEDERILAEHTPGPWDAKYGGAVVKKALGNQKYSVLYDGENVEEIISRDQIRKFSAVDRAAEKSFEVGDLIFYKHQNGLYRNGVISRREDDGTYSIYLLNTSGTKIYHVPTSKLINQFESADFVEEISGLSLSKLEGALKNALLKTVIDDEANLSPIESRAVGAGSVTTAFWKNGSAVLKWDGMKRIDLNLFTYEEDTTKQTRISFQEAFNGEIDHMETISRDEHPRGYGAVVNFASEIANPPHWVL